MLIRSPSLAGMEAKGSRQGGGRRLAGSLSTLLLHSGLQSVLCYSCHRCSVQLGHGVDSKGSVEGLRHGGERRHCRVHEKRKLQSLYTSPSLVPSTRFSVSVTQLVQTTLFLSLWSVLFPQPTL